MANLTSVGITAGLPSSGTGTVSTIDGLMADGGQATLGAKADAKSTATDVTPISIVSVLKQISASVQAPPAQVVTNSGTFAIQEADGANVTLGAKADAKNTATDTTAVSVVSVLKQISASVQAPPSQAVTNAGTFAVQATLAAETTKVIGTTRLADATSTATIKAASTAPVATDTALVVAISPNSVNANGPASAANSAPVVQATCSAGVQANVASSATDVTILASNANRRGGMVFNDSTQVLYLLLASATSSATVFTVQMVPGAYYEVPFNYTGVLKGLWASANGFARVTELT